MNRGNLPQEVKYFLVAVYSTIAILGTLSNTVSVLCLFKQWKSTPHVSNSQKVLMSLIVSDLLVSAVSCPIQVARFFAETNIPTRGYHVSTLGAISSLTIFLLALDRYLKLTRFGDYREIMTRVRLLISIVTCWVFPIVIMSSAWWGKLQVYTLSNGVITCFILIALPILYVLIYRFYKQSKRNVARFSQTKTNDAATIINGSHSSDASVAVKTNPRCKMPMKILMLISTYFICTVIYSSMAFMVLFGITNATVFYLAQAVYLGNSMMNPIIYVFRDAKFRRTVKEMFRITGQ